MLTGFTRGVWGVFACLNRSTAHSSGLADRHDLKAAAGAMLHRRGDRRARLSTGEHPRRHLKGNRQSADPHRIGAGWLRQNDRRSPVASRRQRHGCGQGRSESAGQASKQRTGLKLFNA